MNKLLNGALIAGALTLGIPEKSKAQDFVDFNKTKVEKTIEIHHEINNITFYISQKLEETSLNEEEKKEILGVISNKDFENELYKIIKKEKSWSIENIIMALFWGLLYGYAYMTTINRVRKEYMPIDVKSFSIFGASSGGMVLLNGLVPGSIVYAESFILAFTAVALHLQNEKNQKEYKNLNNEKILIDHLKEYSDVLPFPSVVYDDNGFPIVWNKRVEKETGYTHDEIIKYYNKHGEIVTLQYKGENLKKVQKHLKNVEETGIGYKDVSFTMTTKFGKEKTFLRTNKMSEFGKSMRIGLPITDENEIRIKLAETEKLLKTDYLTGVCNREALLNNLHILFTHQERDKPTNFTISIIDIDNFKTVNDIYGHKIGDQVLQKFAHHLMTSIREGDKVYRIGGDEFIIIFQDTDSESITNKLTHIRESFYKNPIDIDGEKLNIGSSWGLKTINIKDYKNDNLNDTDYSEELFSKIQEKIDCYMYSVKYYKLIEDQLLEDGRITRHSSEKNSIAIELNKNSEFSGVKVVNSEGEFVISVNELLRIKELKKEMAESKNGNMRK